MSPVGRAAAGVTRALGEGSAVHVAGGGRVAHLAAYLAEVLSRAHPQRPLPVRALGGDPQRLDGLARSVEAFARPGDVLLVVLLEPQPTLLNACQAARRGGLTSVALLPGEHSGLLDADLELQVPQPAGFAAVESLLALGHVLAGLVTEGLARQAEKALEQVDTEIVPAIPIPPPQHPTPPTVPSVGAARAKAPPPPPPPPDRSELPTFSGPHSRVAARGESERRPETSKRDRRRASRVYVKDAVVRWARERLPGEVGYHPPHSLEDLSLTGLRFVGRPNDLEVGEDIYLTLDFPAFPQPLQLRAKVRRCIPADNGEGLAIGVRFLEFFGEAEARVQRLVQDDRLRGARRR